MIRHVHNGRFLLLLALDLILCGNIQVDVQVYDQGEPVLSSVTSLTVYVSHSATVPPDVSTQSIVTTFLMSKSTVQVLRRNAT